MGKQKIAKNELITARNITFERSGQPLLKDINLSIASGMITMLLGHNGAGKTLLMQVLHGLLEPSAGEIRTIGRAGQKMVFQKPVMLRRTASQYFDFVCPACLPHKKQDWFHKAGLTGRANTPARLLSGGEQQKLSLIAALATQPDLLFLDEPCANLDFEAIDFVESELLGARDAGMTIIMSCHNKNQAQKLADYIILMRRGRVAEYAEKEHFFSSPTSEAGKEYLSYN